MEASLGQCAQAAPSAAIRAWQWQGSGRGAPCCDSAGSSHRGWHHAWSFLQRAACLVVHFEFCDGRSGARSFHHAGKSPGHSPLRVPAPHKCSNRLCIHNAPRLAATRTARTPPFALSLAAGAGAHFHFQRAAAGHPAAFCGSRGAAQCGGGAGSRCAAGGGAGQGRVNCWSLGAASFQAVYSRRSLSVTDACSVM